VGRVDVADAWAAGRPETQRRAVAVGRVDVADAWAGAWPETQGRAVAAGRVDVAEAGRLAELQPMAAAERRVAVVRAVFPQLVAAAEVRAPAAAECSSGTSQHASGFLRGR
jgi:hypothetical protein